MSNYISTQSMIMGMVRYFAKFNRNIGLFDTMGGGFKPLDLNKQDKELWVLISNHFSGNCMGDYFIDGEEYAKLYLDAAKIIKEKDPTARVLCGAMMGDSQASRRYGEQIFTYIASEGDVNELIDVFSIHKYS